MLKFLLPKQEDFFELFKNNAENLVKVAQDFEKLLNHLDHASTYTHTIEEHERAAHKITEITLEKLHKTFITPFDRYDIHRYVKKLDEAIDSIHRTAQRVALYELTELPHEIKELAGLTLRSAKIIQSATQQLSSLKNATKILELCDGVNRKEAEADTLMLSGVSELFQTESDMRRLLKVKEIYEYSKSCVIGCQVVANIIKDIVLEYS